MARWENIDATINLSILDFKGGYRYYGCVCGYPINLSILDFKAQLQTNILYPNVRYKSIHIGF